MLYFFSLPQLSLSVSALSMRTRSELGHGPFALVTGFLDIRQIAQSPQSEALVRIGAAGLGAALVDDLHRRRPVQGRDLEIERPPVGVLDVVIAFQLREGGSQQPNRAGRLQVPRRAH